MNRKRSRTRDLMASAAELGPEDGSDPKRFHDPRTWNSPRQPGRKARQLCGQIAEALTAIFACLADEVLQNLTVVSVEPAPNTGRLLVTVAGPATADVTDRNTVMEHLMKANGRIRSEVASAITRRKAPELAFAIISE